MTTDRANWIKVLVTQRTTQRVRFNRVHSLEVILTTFWLLTKQPESLISVYSRRLADGSYWFFEINISPININ